MIKITKGGQGEIHVVFPYSPRAVATIKTIGGGRWHPEERYWSFPNSRETLDRIISAFTGQELQIDPCLRSFSRDDLVEKVRALIRTKHYSIRTEKSYLPWVRRYLDYHQNRDPKDMGNTQIEAFLTYLAVNLRVSASTQN
jgi:hypothetical protein